MKKMSLESVTIFSFTFSIAIFKKDAYQQSASFPQATLCFWNLQREIEASQLESFQIV